LIEADQRTMVDVLTVMPVVELHDQFLTWSAGLDEPIRKAVLLRLSEGIKRFCLSKRRFTTAACRTPAHFGLRSTLLCSRPKSGFKYARYLGSSSEKTSFIVQH
jgi:hypothetical protein